MARVLDDRRKMAAGAMPMNWGFAETLAYATLLNTIPEHLWHLPPDWDFLRGAAFPVAYLTAFYSNFQSVKGTICMRPTEQDRGLVPSGDFQRLLEELHGYSHDGFDRSIDAHVKNLRRKIEPDPKNPTYVLTVYGIGYRLAEL